MTYARRKLGEIACFRNGINYVVGAKGEVAKVVGVGDFQDRTELTHFDSLSEIQLGGSVTEDDELKDGDLLFVRSNGSKHLIGRCVVIRNPPKKLTFSGFTIRARLNTAIALPAYVSLIFQEGYIKRQLSIAGGGNGNISNLSQHLLSSLDVDLPDLAIQHSVIDIASEWNIAITIIERLIKAKEAQYIWLSSKLLFGNPVKAEPSSKNRWFAVPEHWKIVRVGSVAKEVKATNNTGAEIPVLSCTKYDGLVDSLSYFGKQVFSMDTSAYKVVSRGEFAYATNHIEEGSIGYQDFYEKGLVSPMYTVFKTSTAIDDGYLFKVLKTETYRHIFQVNTSASVDRRGSLRWNEFAKLPIPLPPIEEQQKISATLDVARQEILLLKQQADALRRQKRGLMQKLMTGVWTVKPMKELGNG